MTQINRPEAWLRGPLPGVPALLQPVAHALLQAKEEAAVIMNHFPDSRLWERPSGLASPGFHLLHLSGVIDRLFTYAKDKMLSPEQFIALESEQQIPQPGLHVGLLLNRFEQQVDKAIEELKKTPENMLLETRAVGRSRIPSTLLGILFHAAEHTQRQIGQLLVTARILADH
jgi:hypothetical protein